MTTAGWAIMIVSISTVVALITFCLVRVLMLPPVEVEDLAAAPLEIDTRDTENPD
jgi:hypothetical protein